MTDDAKMVRTAEDLDRVLEELQKVEVFEPPEEFAAAARIRDGRVYEEAERDPAVPPRDALVDRFAIAEAVAAALARRRGRTDRHRLEIGVEAVERPGGGKRPRELGVERAPARQLEELF